MKKLIIFDLDNTFYDYEISHNFALMNVFDTQKVYLEYENFYKQYSLAKKQVHLDLRGSPSIHSKLIYFKLLFHPILTYEKILELEDIYWKAFIENSYIDIESMNTLKKNKGKEDIYLLFTNQNLHIQLRKLNYWGLDFFDHILTSEEVGYEKPSQEFFDKALDKFKAIEDPSYKLIAVGDSFENDINFWLTCFGAKGYLINNKATDFKIEDGLHISNFQLAIDSIFKI
jgi:HAD superfamily hydrolase (TIGR01549 family)